jgi:hypothetical protein
MVHLIKLAVGALDVAHLSEFQRARVETDPPLRHRTRQMPKRGAELIGRGSIFWVIAGMIQCRQRVLEIKPDQRPDGTPCVALVLDPALVLVEPRPVRPFQGWRYLNPDSAPPDLHEGSGSHPQLPAALRLALAELCLL